MGHWNTGLSGREKNKIVALEQKVCYNLFLIKILDDNTDVCLWCISIVAIMVGLNFCHLLTFERFIVYNCKLLIAPVSK